MIEVIKNYYILSGIVTLALLLCMLAFGAGLFSANKDKGDKELALLGIKLIIGALVIGVVAAPTAITRITNPEFHILKQLNLLNGAIQMHDTTEEPTKGEIAI